FQGLYLIPQAEIARADIVSGRQESEVAHAILDSDEDDATTNHVLTNANVAICGRLSVHIASSVNEYHHREAFIWSLPARR
ncbi:hypothetical protein PMAYCL1PPCAC_25800, partial [Pristionchus mayeri]